MRAGGNEHWNAEAGPSTPLPPHTAYVENVMYEGTPHSNAELVYSNLFHTKSKMKEFITFNYNLDLHLVMALKVDVFDVQYQHLNLQKTLVAFANG